MENNIIHISETKDYKYIGIPVPRDAKNIRIGAGISTANERAVWYGSESNGGMIHVPLSSELMGILGETLTAGQARKILLPYRQYTQLGIMYKLENENTLNPLKALESLIESKGVKVKNRLSQSPPNIKDIEYSPLYFSHEFSRQCYEDDLRYWELAEVEVKKVVIIKIKK